MKKVILQSILILAAYSSQLQANSINVISSNGLFAGNTESTLSTVSALTNSEIAQNLNDMDPSTYLFGSANNGTTTADLTLEFQDTLYNRDGIDFYFTFMGGAEDTNTMELCFSGCSTLT